jgi:hypothetical protein
LSLTLNARGYPDESIRERTEGERFTAPNGSEARVAGAARDRMVVAATPPRTGPRAD